MKPGVLEVGTLSSYNADWARYHQQMDDEKLQSETEKFAVCPEELSRFGFSPSLH
ncbi:MAG: hypothetical protein WAN04_09385 [Candidatus Udaeobacter sp.]